MTLRDAPAALWLALTLLVLPWAAIESARRRRARAPAARDEERSRPTSRPRLYLASTLGIAQFLLVTAFLDGVDRWGAGTLPLARRLGVAIPEGSGEPDPTLPTEPPPPAESPASPPAPRASAANRP